MTVKANRLVNEKSAYLRQHAYNPIDWFPWCEEAFKLAEQEDKPIFLSIGYSACHWCHVMEKESFEDEEIAGILNENFISIKVDREEHIDVDNFYMAFVQATTGSGGWPLSVFLLPDKTPFFGGTYFPPVEKFKKPSFKNVLISVKEIYKTRKRELERLKTDIKLFYDKTYTGFESSLVNLEELQNALDLIVKSYDWSNGGWGSGAKFPMFPVLNFLADYYFAFHNEQTKEMLKHNLYKILQGGIYDHIGGGMHRYTVDSKWIVPHFEKMLYDNAQLILILSKYLLIEDVEFFRTKLNETFDFLVNEMKISEGGFLNSVDADSEGEEGKYYLWNYHELKDFIDKIDYAEIFFNYYRLNIIDDEAGKGIISMPNLADGENFSVINQLDSIKYQLKNYRDKRIPPEKDNKILTDLNSLLISALCFAYRVAYDEKFLSEAELIYRFIISKLLKNDLLFHSFINGDTKIFGYAEDYFSFITASIDLYEVTFNESYLDKAYQLINYALKKFYDTEKNIIYQQGGDYSLPYKTTDVKDYSKPSATSLAVTSLLRLGKIFEDEHLTDLGSKILNKFFKEHINNPFGGGTFLSASLIKFIPPREIIFVEGENNFHFKFFHSHLIKKVYPNQIFFMKRKQSSKNFSYLQGKDIVDKKLTIYICENFTCQRPITIPSEL